MGATCPCLARASKQEQSDPDDPESQPLLSPAPQAPDSGREQEEKPPQVTIDAGSVHVRSVQLAAGAAQETPAIEVHTIVKEELSVQEDREPADARMEELILDETNRGRADPDPSDGGYAWIRKKNDEEARQARRKIAEQTTYAVEALGYRIGALPLVTFENAFQCVEGTIIVSPSCGKWPSTPAAPRSGLSKEPVLVTVADGQTVLQAAMQRAKHRQIAVVNAASAYHGGGGFKTGGRHALEEAICVQSTLHGSLRRAASQAKALGVVPPAWVTTTPESESKWEPYIPDDGVIVSPLVEVFRGGTNEGYPFETQAVTLDAIISVAMPNCNHRVSDSPMDANPDPAGYRKQLEAKWRAVLTAAQHYVRAECLVVPDAGCGVFRNSPEDVGATLGGLLRTEFAGAFAEVVVAFPGGETGKAFAEALSNATRGVTAAPEVPTTGKAPVELSPAADGPGATGRAVWEFSVGAAHSFSPFDEDCQQEVESLYKSFAEAGGPCEVKVRTQGRIVVVDFRSMEQHMEGSIRRRKIRRRA